MRTTSAASSAGRGLAERLVASIATDINEDPRAPRRTGNRAQTLGLVANGYSTASRATRADGEVGDAIYLIKNVSSLKLTYQIRLLTFQALQSRRALIIGVPRRCQISEQLRTFAEQHSPAIQIKRMD